MTRHQLLATLGPGELAWQRAYDRLQYYERLDRRAEAKEKLDKAEDSDLAKFRALKGGK